MKNLEDFVKREKAQNIPKSEKSFVEVFSYSLHKKFYHFWRPLMRTEFDQMTKNNIGWHLKNSDGWSNFRKSLFLGGGVLSIYTRAQHTHSTLFSLEKMKSQQYFDSFFFFGETAAADAFMNTNTFVKHM